MKRVVPLAAAMALLGLPSGAFAIAPFGHKCTPQHGVRFCPTQNDAQRVKGFDGVPLDVDVTLPATGRGPFPTIVMLHGFPGSKESFEASSPAGGGDSLVYHYNNVFYAQHGYAVVNYSARGFGRSCGVADSRTSPGCDRGWFHLADQRFELRDAQGLLSRLADQGVTDPGRIGATGVSYGGGSTLQLAYLRNRIRKLNGGFAPWISRGGKRLHIAAAYTLWGWSDLAYSLVPNGRFLDFDGGAGSSGPLGVAKESITNILYIGGVALGYLAPQGADPTADLATWRQRLFAGEPYGANVRAIANQLDKYKSSTGIPGTPAPVLIMDGWTDPAFNAVEALRAYRRIRTDGDSYVALQLGDLGHFRGGNALAMYKDFSADGAAFFARYLKGRPGGPRSGSVKAYGQGCPKGILGPGPITVSSYGRLARGDILFGAAGAGTIGAGGGDDATGKFFDPVSNGDPCSETTATRGPKTVVLKHRSPGFTLAGLTTISAHIRNTSAHSFGQLDARLFDKSDGNERLIDYGTYRVLPGQNAEITFQLSGNLYRFGKGHVVKLELVGRNEPWFLRDKGFRLVVRDVRVDVPTRDRPSVARGISARPSPD